MSRSDSTFPVVVPLCRIESEGMDGFRTQRRSSCDVPLSVLRGYIQSEEECHINLQHGYLPCLFGPGLGCWASDERQ